MNVSLHGGFLNFLGGVSVYDLRGRESAIFDRVTDFVQHFAETETKSADLWITSPHTKGSP